MARILFLSVFYVGFIKKAPGTWGSIAGVILGAPLLYFDASILFTLALIIGGIGIKQIDIYEKHTQTHDVEYIVIDELVGVWIALSLVSFNFVEIILAFVFFRIYDIWKPSLIGIIDRRLNGGFGVMLDDVLAGILAGLSTKLCAMVLIRIAPNLMNYNPISF